MMPFHCDVTMHLCCSLHIVTIVLNCCIVKMSSSSAVYFSAALGRAGMPKFFRTARHARGVCLKLITYIYYSQANVVFKYLCEALVAQTHRLCDAYKVHQELVRNSNCGADLATFRFNEVTLHAAVALRVRIIVSIYPRTWGLRAAGPACPRSTFLAKF